MICLISGTNRADSQTLRVTRIFDKLFRAQGAETEILDLNQLPAELFLPESYNKRPASFERFNQSVLKSQGLFVVTPEYNGSFPGVLKYFIDMLQFPEAFERRPVAFCGVSAGMWGALRSVEQLEQIFKYRNAFSFSERVFLPRVSEKIDENGQFKEDLVRGLVDTQVKNFLRFCSSLNRDLPPKSL